MKFVNTNRTDNGEGKPLCTCTCYFSYKKYQIDIEEKSNVL
jgi:hypothetical protein